ncbi:MAG TPA: response regulator [Bacteroidales bacterium]|nr:response regulator [Bacteroidales bacterium]
METKKKILLVDDDVDIIAVVETILENDGYEVITACNKTEGLDKAKSEKPDVAIVDVMMTTHYEGFELAETFVKNAQFKGMPVLMQTSIEIFESNDDDVMKFAREYRANMIGKEMDVLLIQDYKSNKAGIDYRDKEGKFHWLSVNGFIRKPVNAKTLLNNVQRVLSQE